jgi:glycerol-3-phosphate acyltransferase PlsY
MKALFIVLTYCLGAVPFGYVFFRLSEKKDIRLFGSQSIGATNVLRLKGWKHAAPVLIFDVLKAALPVWLALRLFDDRRVALAAAFVAVLGHCFPVFIRFRGGKGVSTAMGSYAVLAPLPFSLSLIIFVGVIALTRYVSLGSLLATLAFPALALIIQRDGELALVGLAVFLLIALRHAGNIRRLCRGQERKFGQRLEVKD